MISIRGIGWLTTTGYGQVGRGFHHPFAAGEGIATLPRLGIFPASARNFGRLDALSRTTLAAVALAIGDAGLDRTPAHRQEAGIVGSGSNGSLPADLAYFRDYIENGRTLGRGNLFIYTLPSSSLGEAAIQFGLTGPLLYVAGAERPLRTALETAAAMVAAGDAPRMLAGEAGAEEALYVLVDGGGEGAPLCSLDEALRITESAGSVTGMATQFSAMSTRKGAP